MRTAFEVVEMRDRCERLHKLLGAIRFAVEPARHEVAVTILA